MIDKVNKYNHERLKLLKRAKLKQLESQLSYQKKHSYDEKTIGQTMRDISKVKSELKNL